MGMRLFSIILWDQSVFYLTKLTLLFKADNNRIQLQMGHTKLLELFITTHITCYNVENIFKCECFKLELFCVCVWLHCVCICSRLFDISLTECIVHLMTLSSQNPQTCLKCWAWKDRKSGLEKITSTSYSKMLLIWTSHLQVQLLLL